MLLLSPPSGRVLHLLSIVVLLGWTSISASQDLHYLAHDERALAQYRKWEETASPSLAKDIAALRGDDPVERAYAAQRISSRGSSARGATIALIENIDVINTYRIIDRRTGQEVSGTSLMSLAQDALQSIGRDAVEAVAYAVIHHTSHQKAEEAAKVLASLVRSGRVGSRAQEIMLGSFASTDALVRYRAAEHFPWLDPRTAPPGMLTSLDRLLDDGDDDVAGAALRSTLLMADRSRAAQVTMLSAPKRTNVCKALDRHLVYVKLPPPVMSQLVDTLRSEDPSARRQTACLMLHIDGSSFLPLVIRAMKEETDVEKTALLSALKDALARRK